MRTCDELSITLHTLHLSALNLYRFIITEQFKKAYIITTDAERIMAGSYIDQLDKTRLEIWTRRQLKKYGCWEFLGMRDLRELARDCGLCNYSTITKAEIINGLHKSNEQFGGGNGTSPQEGQIDGESNLQTNQHA